MRKQDDHEKHLIHSDTNKKEPYLFLPTEAEIDALIANCGNKTSTFLQTLKDARAKLCD